MRSLVLIGLFAVAFADVSHLKGNYNYPKPASSQTDSQIAIPSKNSIGKQSAALNRQYLPSVQVVSSNNDQVFVTSPKTVQPLIPFKADIIRDLQPVEINSILYSSSDVHPKIETTTGRQVIIIPSSANPIITTSLPVKHTSASSNNGYKYVTSDPSLVSISGQGSVVVPKIVVPKVVAIAAPSTITPVVTSGYKYVTADPSLVSISGQGSVVVQKIVIPKVVATAAPSTIAPVVTSGYKYVTADPSLVEISGQGSNVVQQTVADRSNGYKYPAGDPSLVVIPGHGSKIIASESIGSPSTVVPSHSLGDDGYKYKLPKVPFNSRK